MHKAFNWEQTIDIELPLKYFPFSLLNNESTKIYTLSNTTISYTKLSSPLKYWSNRIHIALLKNTKEKEIQEVKRRVFSELPQNSILFWTKYTDSDSIQKQIPLSNDRLFELKEYEKINLIQFRSNLGAKLSSSLSDEEAITMRDELYLIADAIFESLSGNSSAIEEVELDE